MGRVEDQIHAILDLPVQEVEIHKSGSYTRSIKIVSNASYFKIGPSFDASHHQYDRDP
jgi:hypothetical protein